MDPFDHLFGTLRSVVNLSQTEMGLVRSLFKVECFKKGSLFLREGEVCNKLGFVAKGIFRYYIDECGDDRTYNFACEGDFICNYESMFRQIPSAKHIQAIEDAEVLVISNSNLQRFYGEIKDGNLFGRVHMEKVYAETIRHLISQYTETAEHRYLKFLKNHPALHQRIPQYYVASYIGVKPQSLSRIRKRLTGKAIY